jgi:hypothetical protein
MKFIVCDFVYLVLFLNVLDIVKFSPKFRSVLAEGKDLQLGAIVYFHGIYMSKIRCSSIAPAIYLPKQSLLHPSLCLKNIS